MCIEIQTVEEEAKGTKPDVLSYGYHAFSVEKQSGCLSTGNRYLYLSFLPLYVVQEPGKALKSIWVNRELFTKPEIRACNSGMACARICTNLKGDLEITQWNESSGGISCKAFAKTMVRIFTGSASIGNNKEVTK